MYVPKHFSVPEQDRITSFIHENGFGDLISQVDNSPFVTHLPFLFDAASNNLRGHIAKANPQWQQLDGQQVLVVLWGPHGYESPGWYSEPGVPTWNYQTVHVYGTARCIRDPDQLADIVKQLTNQYEASFADPWQAEFDNSHSHSIVGISIAIEEIQCKFKLSQNRSEQERRDVIQQLDECGNTSLAAAMLAELTDRSIS